MPHQHADEDNVGDSDEDRPQPDGGQGATAADQIGEERSRAEEQGAPRRLDQHEVAVRNGSVDEADR